MVRRKRSALIAALSFVLIALAVMLTTISATPVMATHRRTPPPTPTPQPTGDFFFTLMIPPSFVVGFQVTDGGFGPEYATQTYGICEYTANFLIVNAVNGSEGVVTLDVLNLPPGVTEAMPDSVSIGANPWIEFHATTAAPLGDWTVTLRGTSGTFVHTIDLPFHIVDQLPPPDCS